MGALRSDRVWLFGGIGLVALLVASGWFLMISPKYAEASDVRIQVEDTTTQLAKLRRQLADLKADNAKLADYQAQLKTYRAALPTDDDIPTFLRQLQKMGTKLDLAVTTYTATGREDSEVVSTVRELPIALHAQGDVDDISKFVKQLQNTQPRAVLINTASLKNEPDEDGAWSLTLDLSAFRLKSSTTTTTITTQ